jgi:DNA-binding XRE family transcriptional regulator
MLNIGGITTELPKQNKWSQSDRANAVNASRDNIGNYERNEYDPSTEMAQKVVDISGVTVADFLGMPAQDRLFQCKN